MGKGRDKRKRRKDKVEKGRQAQQDGITRAEIRRRKAQEKAKQERLEAEYQARQKTGTDA